jgi:hypothetical protein
MYLLFKLNVILFVLAKGPPLHRGWCDSGKAQPEGQPLPGNPRERRDIERNFDMSHFPRRRFGVVIACLAVMAGLLGACAPTPTPTPKIRVMRMTSVSSSGDVQYYVSNDLRGGTEYWCLNGQDRRGRPIQFRVYDGKTAAPTRAKVFAPAEGDVVEEVLFYGTSERGEKWSSWLPQGVGIPSGQMTKKVPENGQTCPGDGGWYGR